MIEKARIVYMKCSSDHRHDPRLEFKGWFSGTVLKMWMVDKTLQDAAFKAEMLNFLFMDCEGRLVRSSQVILKDLFNSYHGVYTSFDEGLYYNNQVLASNIYKNCMFSQGSLQELLAMTEFTVENLKKLEKVKPADIIDGKFDFE